MIINNWWDADADERYWMEVRSAVAGFGEYLLAPQRNGTGGESWSYTLVSFVAPGDRVLHWDKRPGHRPALVGWSEAAGPLETIDWSWQARGSRGRARGVATEGPAWRLPLANYVELSEPITRETVISRRREIASAFRDIEQRSTGSIYPPFQLWENGDVRAAQGYLFKFPAALAHWVFGPRSLATQAGATPRSATGAGKSQGYMSDAAKRVALEKHAVAMAIDYYRSAGASRIEERGKPFDLLVVLDGVERHVEVKGSIGIGVEHIQLTQGEVDHANRHQPTDLFVVDKIHASYAGDGSVVTKGGEVRIWSGWTPSERALRPTHLRYTLPSGG